MKIVVLGGSKTDWRVDARMFTKVKGKCIKSVLFTLCFIILSVIGS